MNRYLSCLCCYLRVMFDKRILQCSLSCFKIGMAPRKLGDDHLFVCVCMCRFSACSRDSGAVAVFSSTLEETTCEVSWDMVRLWLY